MNSTEADSWEVWNQPLTEAERSQIISTVAEAIARRGLQTPASLLIEMHRPLGYMAGQGIILLTPFLAPLLGLERMQTLNRLLADPDTADELLLKLQETAASPTSEERKGER